MGTEFQFIKVDARTFTGHEALLSLLRQSFAYMDGRIDPPSSLHRIDLQALVEKVSRETVFIAMDNQCVVGCVFASRQPDCLYLGKLAVAQSHRRQGVARRLIEQVEQCARESEVSCVDLETRVELVENQRLFEYLGYNRQAENSHPGYSRTTSYRYRKQL